MQFFYIISAPLFRAFPLQNMGVDPRYFCFFPGYFRQFACVLFLQKYLGAKRLYNPINIQDKMHIDERRGIMLHIEKGYDTVTKTFRLPEKMVETLELLARDYKISTNKLVIQCLEYALDNLEPQDTDE